MPGVTRLLKWIFVKDCERDDDFWYADIELNNGDKIGCLEVSETDTAWEWRARFSESAASKELIGFGDTREEAERAGLQALSLSLLKCAHRLGKLSKS